MKVLAIGNALVDVITYLPDEELLSSLNFQKGSMQLVQQSQQQDILRKIENYPQTIAGGGSAANTIHALAQLNVQTGFIGCIGHDRMGQYFLEDLQKHDIKTHLHFSDETTGTAVVMVTPDGERTFATFLGAATHLKPEHLQENIFAEYSLLHIEGYLVHNHRLIEHALQIARQLNMFISFDLSSFNIVEEHKDFLNAILPGNIDILFANEEEAHVLTGTNVPESALLLENFAPLIVVKAASRGSYVYDRSSILHIPAPSVHCLDSTGAGDYYAAGFLFGLLNNKSLHECGQIGTLLASSVIQDTGARIKNKQWSHIYQMLEDNVFPF